MAERNNLTQINMEIEEEILKLNTLIHEIDRATDSLRNHWSCLLTLREQHKRLTDILTDGK